MGKLAGKLTEKLGKMFRSKWFYIGLVVLVLLGAGAVGGSIYLDQRAQTVEFAVEKFNTALQKGDLSTLAVMIDFTSLSNQFAADMAETLGQDHEQRDREQDIVQKRLVALLAGKGGEGEGGAHKTTGEKSAKGKVDPFDDPVFAILKKPTEIVPEDLLAQLRGAPFTLQVHDAKNALLQTKVMHHQLNQEFIIQLAVRRVPDGWQVFKIYNGKQIVQTFMDRVNALKARALSAFEAENSRVRSLLGTYYHIESCRAVLFPPDAGVDVPRLRVYLNGENLGQTELLSSAAVADLKDKDGNKIAALRLEGTRRVLPGEKFEHSWFFSFEQDYPEVKALLAARELTCTGTTVNAQVGTEMLYPRKITELPGVKFH